MTNLLTANGALRIGDDYQALLMGGVLATSMGAFGVDVTGSRARIASQTMSGWRLQTNWSKTFTSDRNSRRAGGLSLFHRRVS